ncbi:hypothetical protein M422DRAFT_34368 [Sphaerobolus stellatus SS14]|uniref:Unplaced genomic scaffold SPHSTscaffold_105, whole genome shotgun sequence n=1 Tax=Sphaerobolus stellatus (strain SS14) TaxID=990650 RepID=A0A0C9UN17_SPHS4|nr:hypothetical protein M422DRAFT_34368 [Sphaerobolus stellatus SS14]
MTLVQNPGHNNFDVDNIMFSYAAGTVRVHGLTNPICIHFGSNAKEEQHKHKWFIKCLDCKSNTGAVECPLDVTGAV